MWNFSLEDYIDAMKAKHLKITTSRLAFLKAITSMDKKHFTVNEIIGVIKENEGHVNVMSVYNVLELLLKEHLIFANTFDGKNLSYEKISSQLVHVRCDYCGKMFHLDTNDSELDNEWFSSFGELTKKYGVEIEHFKLEAHGICYECKEKNASENL